MVHTLMDIFVLEPKLIEAVRNPTEQGYQPETDMS